ncbi:sporulation peptidase YabG [Aureibacillus halotolerans]|uniref:Spore coat assembly protein n=1 Tax=Aureibacillus halotolerans TaxID=1508390 RepID=A0A4V3D4C0_9BACI|nr:sporulation peptidase YabG [Aureibacillus halotolerans]TDQ34238.1 spore coat assembly protein [Aureibacillus halotolerans]
MEIKVGDVVARVSYGKDVLFRVVGFEGAPAHTAILAGEELRLMADAPVDDLQIVNEREKQEKRKFFEEKTNMSYRLFRQDHVFQQEKNAYRVQQPSHDVKTFRMPGKVLHIDGDPLYLKKCMELYDKLEIPVYSVHLKEKEMPDKIIGLLELARPDILVITGHDAYIKGKGTKNELKAYRHSRYFAKTVYEARRRMPHLDQLIIFAGACQSHFESLIRAGANYASSPGRVNIHALDPVYVVAKLSYTPFMERVHTWDVLKNTLSGEKGLGGIESRGLLRTGMPYTPVDNPPEMGV